VLAFPTNDDRVCVAAGRARAEFHAYRANIEVTFFDILDAAPEFAAKVRAGKREERWMGTADVPNFFRKPWGPGWALVGDAGYMKDPVTGFGIADAFRDAGLLASALDDTLSGRASAEDALGGYQSKRDAAAIPVYEMTLMMASGEMPLPSEAAPA
jgi:flavin-dependent dehydrogenase